jgi:hypothetical protein
MVNPWQSIVLSFGQWVSAHQWPRTEADDPELVIPGHPEALLCA